MHEIFLMVALVLVLCAYHPLKSTPQVLASVRRLEQSSNDPVLLVGEDFFIPENKTDFLTASKQAEKSMAFSKYHIYPLSLTWKLYNWSQPAEEGYPLSPEMLQRSTEFEGSLAPIKSLTGRLVRSNAMCSDERAVNEEIHVMVVGGSVTRGGCAYSPCFEGQQHRIPVIKGKNALKSANRKCQTSWSMLFQDFLSKHYPCLKVVLANEAKEGSKLVSVLGSLAEMVNSDLEGWVDLVIIDYSVNEGSGIFRSEQEQSGYANTILSSHEIAVRTLLSMDYQPALLYLETFGTAPDWFYGQQALHRKIAEHYDFPIVSYLNAVWPTKGKAMWKGTGPNCPHCRMYWSNALIKECGVHPGWYTHQLVSDVLAYNFLRWERLAAPPALVADGEETDALMKKRNTPTGIVTPAAAGGVPSPPSKRPLPEFYNPEAAALQTARCGKAAPDVRYDARRARAELLLRDEARTGHPWNPAGPPAGATGAAGDDISGHAWLHGQRGLRSAPRQQTRAGRPQKKKPGNRPSPPSVLPAGLWGAGYGQEQRRRGHWMGSTHWQLTEDVPGKPGWVANKNSTGGRISFRVACPGSVTVEYLRSYEHIGQAWAFFSGQPLAAAPQPPRFQRRGPQFLDVGAGLLDGKWASPTSQSHVMHLFCRPLHFSSHSASSSSGEEETKGCLPPTGQLPLGGGGDCFIGGMQSIGSAGAGNATRTNCDTAGITEANYGLREGGAWFTIDFSASLNSGNPWPKFKVLAVQSFACAKSQVVWDNKELLRAHSYIKACS